MSDTQNGSNRIEIRSLTPNDIEEVVAMVAAVHPDRPEMGPLVRKDLGDVFSNANTRPEFLIAELVVSDQAPKIVGCAGFIMAWVEWRVYNMFWVTAHADHKGAGIGTALVEAVLKEIRGREGALAVELSSVHAVSYFSRFGFVETARIGKDELVLMRLVL